MGKTQDNFIIYPFNLNIMNDETLELLKDIRDTLRKMLPPEPTELDKRFYRKARREAQEWLH